jgi:hypothetical protein
MQQMRHCLGEPIYQQMYRRLLVELSTLIFIIIFCLVLGFCSGWQVRNSTNKVEKFTSTNKQMDVICTHYTKGLKCLNINGGVTKYRCGNEACRLTPIC